MFRWFWALLQYFAFLCGNVSVCLDLHATVLIYSVVDKKRETILSMTNLSNCNHFHKFCTSFIRNVTYGETDVVLDIAKYFWLRTKC